MARIIDVSKNRQAFHDYDILDQFEAGLVLLGEEIKSIRKHSVELKGSYGRILGGSQPELFWVNGFIASKDPHRTRKLLIHKKELMSLIGKTQQKGLTLIPLSLYLKNGRAKLSMAIAKGKQLHDKRRVIQKRDLDRQMRRSLVD
jgi:SsrA-binding protein